MHNSGDRAAYSCAPAVYADASPRDSSPMSYATTDRNRARFLLIDGRSTSVSGLAGPGAATATIRKFTLKTARKMRDVRSVDAAGRKFCPQNGYNQDDSQTSFSVQFLCLRPPHGDNAGLRGARRGKEKLALQKPRLILAPTPPPQNKPQPSSAVDRQRGHYAGEENEHRRRESGL